MFKNIVRAVMSLAIVAGLSVTAVDAMAGQGGRNYDRTVRVFNNSSYTITHIFASNEGREGWGRDHIKGSVLPPGYYVDVNLNERSDYCIFDFKFRVRGGAELERYGVDACFVETYTLND